MEKGAGMRLAGHEHYILSLVRIRSRAGGNERIWFQATVPEMLDQRFSAYQRFLQGVQIVTLTSVYNLCLLDEPESTHQEDRSRHGFRCL
jgi:hypothetical protein